MACQNSVSSNTEGVNPRKRRKSRSPPPYMADLRIWLLGEIWADKCSVGNLLLGRNAFHTEAHHSLLQCVKTERGQIEDQIISVTITPNLFDQKTPDVQISQALNYCVKLSAPGPHVLLLILRSDTFTERKLNVMTEILNTWSDQILKHTMILMMKGYSDEENEPDYNLLKHKLRLHNFLNINTCDQSLINELFEKIKTLDKENKGNHVSLNLYESLPEIPSTSFEQPRPKVEKVEKRTTIPGFVPVETLNLVLFGKNNDSKHITANTILNQTEESTETIHTCVKREGEICGRPVTLIEMPELYNTSLSQMDVMNETYRALSLCSFNIHAFLMVIPVAPLTDDDKGELAIISDIFDTDEGKLWDYLMILFMCEEDTGNSAVTDLINKSGDVQELIQKCGNKYHILSINKKYNDVSELLQKIDTAITCQIYPYSCDMYVEAQLKNRVQLEARILEMQKEHKQLKKIKRTAESERTTTNCLRMVLVGKTGNGKSATGNTILNRKAFKSEFSFVSVTFSCQKEEGFINGVPVAVVDTPGLFDTQYSNNEVKNEILKCISLLSPGPHVFLLVLSIGRYTKEEMETLNLIKETFGKNAGMFSIIIFTHGDKLQGQPIESSLNVPHINKLIQDCGGRYHVFDNTKQDNSKQVSELLNKINTMIEKNGGGCYTNDVFKEAETVIQQEMERILKQKEEEMEREKNCLREKLEDEMAEMKMRMEEQRERMKKEWKVREEELRMKGDDIRKRDEKEKNEKQARETAEKQSKIEEERQQKEWEKRLKDIKHKKDKLEKELQKKEQEERERYEREKGEMEQHHLERLKRERDEEQRRIEEERQQKEWEKKWRDMELKREQDEEDYREKMNKERSEWEQKQKKITEEFEKEKKRREETENLRIEQERTAREKIKREYENSKEEMKKQREEWEKSKKVEQDERKREEEKRREEEREKLRKLKEDFKREREEEEAKRKREDKARREQEEKERKEMEEEYERKLKDMKRKYEDEARKQAEEFNEFREKYNKDFQELMMKHNEEMQELKRKHEEESLKYKEEFSKLSDLSTDKEKNLNEQLRQMQEEHQREFDELKMKYDKKCALM